MHKGYKIIPQELRIHRQQGWPLPSMDWEVRYGARLARRTPRHLWERPCAKCGRSMQTTYDPKRPETMYCEKCYLAVVY